MFQIIVHLAEANHTTTATTDGKTVISAEALEFVRHVMVMASWIPGSAMVQRNVLTVQPQLLEKASAGFAREKEKFMESNIKQL